MLTSGHHTKLYTQLHYHPARDSSESRQPGQFLFERISPSSCDEKGEMEIIKCMHSAGGRCMFARLKIKLARRTSSVVSSFFELDLKSISSLSLKQDFQCSSFSSFTIFTTIHCKLLMQEKLLERKNTMKFR